MEFTCSEKPNGVTVHIGSHQGSYVPWWTSLQVEVYGRTAPSQRAAIVGRAQSVESTFDSLRHVTTLLVHDNGRGEDLQVDWNQ
jgi:alpha-glucosidase